MRGTEKVEVSVEFQYHADKAVLVNDGDKDVWVPKSQIEDEDCYEWDEHQRGETIVITIPEWLAEDKGLI